MSVISTIGDSQTDDFNGWNVLARETWGHVLQSLLALQGKTSTIVRGFGNSGDTSTQNLARADVLQLYEKPDIAGIYIGVNDPGAAISQATTQANVQAMLKSLKYGAVGQGLNLGVTASAETALPAGGQPGQRYVVLADGSSTGGVAATNPGDHATISGAGGAAQTVWENRNPLAGTAGWGRVATAATAPFACKRVFVVTCNYLNFTTGGDTPSTDYASYATVRAAQAAAVTAENVAVAGDPSVILADLHLYQKTRIVGGTVYGQTFAAQTDPNFSADTGIVPTTAYSQSLSWHAFQNNQHHNNYGHWIVAQAVLAAITSQTTGWLAALN